MRRKKCTLYLFLSCYEPYCSLRRSSRVSNLTEDDWVYYDVFHYEVWKHVELNLTTWNRDPILAIEIKLHELSGCYRIWHSQFCEHISSVVSLHQRLLKCSLVDALIFLASPSSWYVTIYHLRRVPTRPSPVLLYLSNPLHMSRD